MDINNLKLFNDERGCLIPIEFNSLPFEPKRIFIVNNVPVNSIRGNHAHHTTKQLIICINGSVDVLLNDGTKDYTYRLEKGEQILVPELVWDSQQFLTENAELLVICSTPYEYDDYIFSFIDFLNIKKNA